MIGEHGQGLIWMTAACQGTRDPLQAIYLVQYLAGEPTSVGEGDVGEVQGILVGLGLALEGAHGGMPVMLGAAFQVQHLVMLGHQTMIYLFQSLDQYAWRLLSCR